MSILEDKEKLVVYGISRPEIAVIDGVSYHATHDMWFGQCAYCEAPLNKLGAKDRPCPGPPEGYRVTVE